MSEEKKYWWQSAKIYELYIDKFASDIKKLTDNLDYFGILGVNTLHILPHYPSPMVDDGYDISDYRGVRPELGTMEDFKNFLTAARAKGIRVIIDLVINHTSDQHPWFVEARSSKNNPKRDYYLWSETGEEYAEAPNMFPAIEPHNWIKNELTGDFYFATFYSTQPDLNWDNPAVFDEMTAVMEFWAGLGVDGFRIDAASHLIKRNGTNSVGLPETHATLKKMRASLQQKYPDVIMLAESGADSEKYFGDGDECHMAYNFSLMRQMWLTLMQGDRVALDHMIQNQQNIPTNCAWAVFLRNHDEISLGALSDEEVKALQKFLDPKNKYLFDTYPAVRIADVFDGDKGKIIEALKMLYSMPGAPIMYYGDEIGMRNLGLLQGIQDARKYVRGDFDWPEASKQMKDPTSLFNRTAAIIHGSVVPAEQTPIVATS